MRHVLDDANADRHQAQLKKEMEAEIDDQTFQFPAERIARMLAPKAPKPGKVTEKVRTGEHALTLSDYDFTVDPVDICRNIEVTTYNRPQGNEERDVYDPLCAFLNGCILACKNQLETLTGGLCPDLNFHSWDETTDEQSGHTFSLKPDLVGVDGTTNLAKFYWPLPVIVTSSTLSADDPEEVENGWLLLVAQAATCARDMFRASPLRAFCLVVGLDHVENELRFMIFHRGGLTATLPIEITEPEGAKAICCVLTAILLWKSPSDAGLPAFTIGKKLKLTEDCDVDVKEVLHAVAGVRGRSTWVAEISVAAPQEEVPVPVVSNTNREKSAAQDQDAYSGERTVSGDRASKQTGLPPLLQHKPTTPLEGTAVLKMSWPEHSKRNLEHNVLSRVSGEFGAPVYYAGSLVYDAHDIPISNHLFLPEDDAEIKNCWWDLFAWEHPSQPDRRLQNATLTLERGTILTECKDEDDLVACLRHAILGWLTWYQNGAFHRDVSIGNIIKLFAPEERKPFTVSSLEDLLDRENFGSMKYLGDVDLGSLNHADHNARRFLQDVEESRSQVDEQVKKMNVGVMCRAFLSDADCAADLKTDYFGSEREGIPFGTPQFQSKALTSAIRLGGFHRQSPLDDMESYVWTTLWALLKHDSRDRATEPDLWQKRINAGANIDDIKHVISVALKLMEGGDSDRFEMLYFCAAMLQRVHTALGPLREPWEREISIANTASEELRPALFMLLFHKYAYQGCLAVLRDWENRPEDVVKIITDYLSAMEVNELQHKG